MNEIKAPYKYHDQPHPWLFLSGSIEMGVAEPWQEEIVQALRALSGTILNPRRNDWDSSWVQDADNPQFYEQVSWELDAMMDADLIAIYFSPETKAPITLLELGLFADSDKVIVCCPKGFWKRGNVDIVCMRNSIAFLSDKQQLIKQLKNELGGRR